VSASGEPFLLVVNPRAGAGRAERRLGELTAALGDAGARFDVARTSSSGHATTLVREAIRAGVPGVAIVGGDGTLSEAVRGFFDERGVPIDTDAWLAPLSSGTGGDFRRTLGSRNLPALGTAARRRRAIGAIVARMLASVPRAVDVGWLEHVDHRGTPATRAFLNIASFGISGLVDQLVTDGPKWIGGTPAFVLATARSLLRFDPQRVAFSIDGGAPRESAVIGVAVANGRYFGSGLEIAPRAVIDDGLFDVVIVESSLLATARLVARMYSGRHLGRPGVAYHRATRVDASPLDPASEVLLDVDGEAPGRLPATFTIRPGALRLRG
jgi:diacylglycerol kinase (ATP)